MVDAFKGWTEYEGLLAHQVANYLDVWSEFLSRTRPARILEIGTSHGGFILSLKDRMRLINPACVVRTYDMNPFTTFPGLREKGVDVRLENNFNHMYDDLLLHKRPALQEFIQAHGTSVVICDGGSKKNEFNLLSPFLKDGDFIFAHDYAETEALFEAEIKGRVWNWCEITEKDIWQTAATYNLRPFMKAEFQSVVWVCKVKTPASAPRVTASLRR